MIVSPTSLDRVFFVPDPKFFDYLEAICPAKNIVDIGAGQGLVSKLLANKGFKVLAVDIIPPEDTYYEVVAMDIMDMYIPKNALPILCRPCHGDFPGDVVVHALENGVPKILYVGLTRNIERDLSGLMGIYKMEIAPFFVGKDEEIAVLISKQNK